MADHSEQIEGVAARIANQLIKGEKVTHGPEPWDNYRMLDVQQFMLDNDELCERFDALHYRLMLVGSDAELMSKLEQLRLDAIGKFSEEVARQVFNFEQEDVKHYD